MGRSMLTSEDEDQLSKSSNSGFPRKRRHFDCGASITRMEFSPCASLNGPTLLKEEMDIYSWRELATAADMRGALKAHARNQIIPSLQFIFRIFSDNHSRNVLLNWNR